ncbi:MAG: GEVED domain-containing protein, partial [Bacteroidota bacterium]
DLVDAGAGTGEQDYETQSANGGPVHKIITDNMGNVTLKIGSLIDDELDGQQSDDADGDGDDEDGFDPGAQMFETTVSQDITVPVMNMTGGDAKLTMYVDWNNDGVFEDMYSVTVPNNATEATLASVTPPVTSALNEDVGVRFRLTTSTVMDPNGPAPDGEVEDYEIMVMGYDYGDLADAGAGTGVQDYETESANGGPRHKIVTDDMGNVTLKIGALIDDEADGQASDDADGDGDDEDGFDPTAQMFVTTVAQDIDVLVMNMTGGDAKLTMYVDWNNDGVFEDMYSVTVPNNATEATLAAVTPPLTTALNQDIGVRFRLTTSMVMDPNGDAPDGEIEDYEITVMGFDYGDLADEGAGAGEQDYETESGNGGPRHKIVTDDMGNVTLKIGSDVDDEADGQPSDDADGDGDDEDGFDPTAQMFETTIAQDITVPVMNMTGGDAKLTMYVDWNNDGVFEDMYSVTVPNNATEATLASVTPPVTSALNEDVGVRFRLTTSTVMDPNGDAPDGEVEDYEISVMGYDYGDLADAGAGTGEQDYETESANGGPRHKIVTDDMGNVTLKIGALIDDEGDGQESADADGDGDDEDGFDPTAQMFETTVAQDITVPVMNMTGGDAKLTMYVDWNNDGVFEDMYSVTVPNNATEATLAAVTPPLTTALNQDIGVRFRLTTDTAMDPNGEASDGEIEDYEITVMGYDYGDLVDAGDGEGEQDYETATANGGPRHKIVSDDMGNVTLKIGAEVDDEADGQQSDDADGDNNADADDEDGFDPTAQMFETTVAQDITLPVMNMTGGDAKLTMYVDWDNDGIFEDMYSVTVPNNATEATLAAVTPPLTSALNQDIGARFRLTTDTAMDPNSEASDGEVEDYEITVMGYDYGDLADAGAGTGEQDYETESANGGPRHKIVTDDAGNVTLKIGSLLDDEGDGQQSADADGDNSADADDEDGFDPTAQMFETTVAQDITVPVMNMTGGDAKLTMYVDWNNDGVFEDMYSVAVPNNATEATLAAVTPPLTTALNQDIGVRFRLTTDAAMDPNGEASDGEVEDYEITVMGYDYGDLVDTGDGEGEQNYETATANGGPRHKIISDDMGNITLKIGSLLDDEADGQQSDDADGDNNADDDDEDGFDPNAYMFVTGQAQVVDIPVMNMTGGDAKLTLYVDWNNNGVFDGGDEMYSTTVANNATNAQLTLTPPTATTVLNDELGLRIRLTTDMAMSPEGEAPDGEVEDYEITVMGFDYGDLVDTGDGTGEQNYETSAANGGPSHKIVTNEDDMVLLKIGAANDDEADGQPTDDADGDITDVDDEDGFDPNAYMFVTGTEQTIDFPVMNMTTDPAKLTVYVDWNNDGAFDGPDEMYSTTVTVGQTLASITLTPPTATTTLNDELGFRIRLTTDTEMSPEGPASDGEVEDYLITVMGFDYGDLADADAGLGEQDYETLAENGGPRHKIITNEDDQVLLKIGATVDDDGDGQPDSEASSDDAVDGDDEDGIETNNITFITGQSQDITIPVMNMTGQTAKLVMFVDWNNDGDFDDADEMYMMDVLDGQTSVTFASVTPPLTATLNDDLGMRLRLSTDATAAASPFGEAPDGEVEDHEVIIIQGFDYGDLPDSGPGTGGDPDDPLTPANYQTLADDDGAKHGVVTNEQDEVILKLGAAADDEADGQPSADAGATTGGDDNIATPGTDPDDEDGLDLANIPLFILTQTTTLEIPVMNMTDESATLAAFIDYNKDGAFDPATEKYVVEVPVNATSVSLDIGPIPATSVVGQDVGLRLRLANDMAEVMAATGCAATGEVEDYMVQIVGFDYGDLPNTFVTTGDEAPRHVISEDLKLGSCVDTEIDGFPEPMAGLMEGGDDADPGLATFGECEPGSGDEDGVQFLHPIIPGNESCLTIDAMNMTAEDAVLQAWIDWDNSGTFEAGEELVFTDATVPVGGADSVEYCFPVPADVSFNEGALFVRVRLSPDGGLAPDQQLLPIPFGEIEDYKVQLSKVGNLVWEDYNGDGVQDEGPERGLNGVVVELFWYGPDGDPQLHLDNRTYTVTTANDGTTDGMYNFCGLVPGTYTLSVPSLPGDFVPSWADIPGDEEIDSDEHDGVLFTIVDPLGLTENEAGTGDNPGGLGFPDPQDDLRYDFGAFIPAEIGDFVWLDENFDAADDTQDDTGSVPDTPIPGVTVRLSGMNNIGDPVEGEMLTDANGFYEFTDLAPGSYRMTFDASTALEDCGPVLLAVDPNVGGDDSLDSDQDPSTFTTPFYDLFSGDDIMTVDAGFVEPDIEFGCIADLNVTLGDDCTAVITEDMVLTGLYYCIDEYIINVDDSGTDQVVGCGEHTYMITLIEDGEEVYTCWGNIFAEDKTDPVVECPDDVSDVTVEFALQTLQGSLDGTEDVIELNDYS